MSYPTKRTPDLDKEVLERLSKGEPLAKICRDEHMPHPTTWRDWCEADQALAIAYGRAREEGFDAIAVQCIDIADDTSNDTIETDSGQIPNKEWIMRSKLRVETRLKLLSKWSPKTYGDKLEVEHAGGITLAVSSEDAGL